MKPPGRRRQVGTPIRGARARVRFWEGRVGRVRGWGWEGVVRRRRRRVRRVVVRGRCMAGFFCGGGKKGEVGFGEWWNGVEYGFNLSFCGKMGCATADALS